jgi:hypothetical protein
LQGLTEAVDEGCLFTSAVLPAGTNITHAQVELAIIPYRHCLESFTAHAAPKHNTDPLANLVAILGQYIGHMEPQLFRFAIGQNEGSSESSVL